MTASRVTATPFSGPGPVKAGRRNSDRPAKPRLDPKDSARRAFIASQDRHDIGRASVAAACGLRRDSDVAKWRSPDCAHLPNLAHLSRFPRQMAIDAALFILEECGERELADAVRAKLEARHEAAVEAAQRELDKVRALRGCG